MRPALIFVLLSLATRPSLSAQEAAAPATPAPVPVAAQLEASGSVDPFAAPPAVVAEADKVGLAPERSAKAIPSVRLRIEVWEVDKTDFSRVLDEAKDEASLAKWRSTLLAKQAPFLCLCTLAEEGVEPKSESITERIYPAEYDPPDSPDPQTAAASGPGGDAKARPPRTATPTAFEMKPTGTTLVAGVRSVSAEPGKWDVSFCVEDVRLAGWDQFPPEHLAIKEPVFTTWRARQTVRLHDGAWRMLSAQEPPRGPSDAPQSLVRILFVRAEVVK